MFFDSSITWKSLRTHLTKRSISELLLELRPLLIVIYQGDLIEVEDKIQYYSKRYYEYKNTNIIKSVKAMLQTKSLRSRFLHGVACQAIVQLTGINVMSMMIPLNLY